MTTTTAQRTQANDAWAILKDMGDKPVCALIRDKLAEHMTGEEMIAFGDRIARDGHEKARREL